MSQSYTEDIPQKIEDYVSTLRKELPKLTLKELTDSGLSMSTASKFKVYPELINSATLPTILKVAKTYDDKYKKRES